MVEMVKLLIATNNNGKQIEFRELLAGWPGEILFPRDLGLSLDVEERGDSFAEIAVLKARAYACASGLPSLADDSGLEVDALDGAPGIYTARYAGPGASDADRYRKLLAALGDTPTERRTARFRCAVALAYPGGKDADYEIVGDSKTAGGQFATSGLAGDLGPGQVAVAEGTCEGVIAFEPRGEHGFGYDPVFYLPEVGRTMAELSAELKNRISHRARAVQAAQWLLDALLETESSGEG
jgi:XTP/dITP diphosphohydrolase